MDRKRHNVEKKVAAATTVRSIAAADRGDLGFMARMLVLATLPHKNPGNVEAWGRQNGNYSLVVQPGVRLKNGKPHRIGIPYGTLPRLVLAWLTTEAVRTKNRRVVLGSSLSEFMAKLDQTPTGGRWGSITRLKDQMTRLFAARVTASYDDETTMAIENIQVADKALLFWDPKRPEQAAVWESTVLLSQPFFDEVVERPVPVDMHVLKHLTRSPLALDLYMWLTYRASYMNAETAVSWEQLHAQFGADYKETKDFTKYAKKALTTIKLAWPDLKYRTPRGRLVLQPSPTHVKRKPVASS